MSEPIKAGDLCEVIAGAFGIAGPNVGKQVTVKELRGEHSQFGRIWRCEGRDIISEFGAVGGQADFAQSWLRKLPPTVPHAANDEKTEFQA
jgi:hypothetical protein